MSVCFGLVWFGSVCCALPPVSCHSRTALSTALRAWTRHDTSRIVQHRVEPHRIEPMRKRDMLVCEFDSWTNERRSSFRPGDESFEAWPTSIEQTKQIRSNRWGGLPGSAVLPNRCSSKAEGEEGEEEGRRRRRWFGVCMYVCVYVCIC